MRQRVGLTMDILAKIEAYEPYNAQEARDKERILRLMAENADIFTRENDRAHMTASAWVVNAARDKVLMVYHNIYDSWSWLGGHADGEEDLLGVALREVREESGLTKIRAVSEEIYSLEILTVGEHRKNGKCVEEHLHLNLTYLIEADEEEPLHVKEDENSGVRWFTVEEALAASSEPWMVENVYKKLARI